MDEANNVVRYHCDDFKKVLKEGEKMPNHIAVFQKLAGTDCERGTKVAGARGYYLTGPGALLN